jgi:hypothetical protein
LTTNLYFLARKFTSAPQVDVDMTHHPCPTAVS